MLNILKKWRNPNREQTEFSKEEILKREIPEHIAIIMDGNGRWAKKRALPRIAGHHEGMKVVRKVTKLSNELGVKALTLYAFSTENWKRPKTEVDYLMKLPEEFLGTFLPELIEENVQVRIIGEESKIPEHTLRAVQKAKEDTINNNGLILNFALNYGSRAEMIHAVKGIVQDAKKGDISSEDINEALFSQYLMTKDMRDPDLLIRTSGEIRLSNFMLWQLAYSEFVFTDVLWPDFSEDHLLAAIKEYQHRGRRFGGL
ncbi:MULTISPECIES: isoprenyl transferase [Metabacillus]|jgi:undecaprenyl diphosphate synthase|uniref:Isoprenyl transferase n=1 Tax=Metabacillus hrfriensis TaxID=3048891 RepID=A0ACD4RH66_9BACI|nr:MULTISPECIES: isoprenyl transferase [Metabacillus]UAL54286.1 isoprenyl transferase [Metabacillus dongyingensis]USK30606.1 isoprenyl transferase [Bacillus sp. CMF21]WHZ59856.1 isoprenyl transferase [Metabacillus sp. CT-WN-B3]